MVGRWSGSLDLPFQLDVNLLVPVIQNVDDAILLEKVRIVAWKTYRNHGRFKSELVHPSPHLLDARVSNVV
jgi:hypothetical protein